MKKADFTIVSIPDMIWFYCPYCGEPVGIKYGIPKPQYFGGEWDDVRCTECNQLVKLGKPTFEPVELKYK